MRMIGTWILVFAMGAAPLAAAEINEEWNGGPDEPPASTPGTIDEVEGIRKLEIEIEKLKADRIREAGLPRALRLDSQDQPAPRPEVDFKASFTDGIHIKSTDGNVDLHVGGRVEEEYRYTWSRPSDTTAGGGGNRTSFNSFYSREVFLIGRWNDLQELGIQGERRLQRQRRGAR